MPLKTLWLRSLWLPVVLAFVPALLTLWAASPPGGYFDIALLAFASWLVVGTLWLVTAVRTILALPQPRRKEIGKLWPLTVFPCLFVGLLLAANLEIPSRAMFELHKSELEDLVTQQASTSDQRIGIFTASSMTTNHATGCTRVTINDAGFFDSTGYAYCPNQSPTDDIPADESTTYHHLSGNWYTFKFSW